MKSNFQQVRQGLEANSGARLSERARLKEINEAIMGLPEAVHALGKTLMFRTQMSADEIVAMCRAAPGGDAPSAEEQRLGSLGSAEAARLLGREDPGVIFFGSTEPTTLIPDLDSELAKKGAEMAQKFKAAGLLGNNNGGGPRRMA